MVRYPKRTIALAVALSALAGYVDAIGFLSLGGFFVSFMSGNSTRLGVSFGTQHWPQMATAFGLILLFVIGVILGTVVGTKYRDHRRRAVLILVTVLLLAGSIFYQLTHRAYGGVFQVLAMGAVNAVFERDGEVSVGVTYTTGSLVKAAQRIALALQGGAKWTWIPYVCLWLGLATGAAAGSVAFGVGGPPMLWLAVAYSALIIPFAEWVP